MERLDQPYDVVWRMPAGRRKRFVEEMTAIDRWRADKRKNMPRGRFRR